MFAWISKNSDVLQVLLNGLMVVIWIAYLQVFLVSFRRKQRADVLINAGAGVGLNARCFVSNLSLEPLYLLDVMVELGMKEGNVHEASIAYRAEMSEEQMGSPAEATNQGPLESGGYIDIGSFHDLLRRASPKLEEVDFDAIDGIMVTVLAQTSSNSQLVGACREYRLGRGDDQVDLHPTDISATQIRSWRGRRQLRQKMRRRLEAVQDG